MWQGKKDTVFAAHVCPWCVVSVLEFVDIVCRNGHNNTAHRHPYGRPWNPRHFPIPHLVEHLQVLELEKSGLYMVGKGIPHQYLTCPPTVHLMIHERICFHMIGLLQRWTRTAGPRFSREAMKTQLPAAHFWAQCVVYAFLVSQWAG
jgi:hypothetical protein